VNQSTFIGITQAGLDTHSTHRNAVTKRIFRFVTGFTDQSGSCVL